LAVHREAIEQLAQETGTTAATEAPAWRGGRRLSVKEFEAVTAAFEQCLQERSLPLRSRLRAGCHLIGLLSVVRPQNVRDQRFVELMQLLTVSAVEEAASAESAPVAPLRTLRLFRQWLFLHAISDDPNQLNKGPFKKFKSSLIRYRQARQFARGSGPIPLVNRDWPTTDFETVARIERGADDALESVCRIMRVKLEAHSFAGPAYYHYDLISGLTALCLLPSVIGWFARLAAVSSGRSTMTPEDVLNGVRQAHHTFGISPVFSRFSERLRLRAIPPGMTWPILNQYGP
jgi:hypothetical protein